MQRRMSPGGATSWIRRRNSRGLRTHNAAGHYPETGLAAARAAPFGRWNIAKADGEPGRAGLPGL